MKLAVRLLCFEESRSLVLASTRMILIKEFWLAQKGATGYESISAGCAQCLL